MRYLCTYFDFNYLVRALPLYESLLRWAETDFTLYALCLDEDCESILRQLKLPSVVIIPLQELEAGDKDLLSVKGTRSKIEYYFTITPCLIQFLLCKNSYIDRLMYIDADMYFFNSVSLLYQEWAGNSLYITPHRFPARLKYLLQAGEFNVGIIGVCNNIDGRACMTWWRERCLEWCYDRVELTRFADQKYLDMWPELFVGLCISSHLGINTAAWNVEQYSITKKDGNIYVDGLPLVIYHFQGYKRLSTHMIDPGLNVYHKLVGDAASYHILRPYTSAVIRAEYTLSKLLQGKINVSGNSRIADRTEYMSIIYKIRLFIEGRVLVNVGHFAWYCRQTVIVKRWVDLIISIRHIKRAS